MHTLDALDRRLLDLLRADGRASYRALAAELHLSPAAVKRRVRRLTDDGVIKGFTAIVDDGAAGRPLQAFVELRFAGATSVGLIEHLADELDEVEAFFTTAGDPDALAWIRVDDMDHLKTVIDGFRRSGRVTGTKTLMVLGSWQRRRP